MTSRTIFLHPAFSPGREALAGAVEGLERLSPEWLAGDSRAASARLESAETVLAEVGDAAIGFVVLLPDPTLRGLHACRARVTKFAGEGESMKALEALLRDPITHSRYSMALAHFKSAGVSANVLWYRGLRPAPGKLVRAAERNQRGVRFWDVSKNAALRRGQGVPWRQAATEYLPWMAQLPVDDSGWLDRYRELTARYRDEVSDMTDQECPWI